MVDGFTLPKADKREDTSTQIRLTKVCDDFVDKLANETNHTKQEVLEAIVTKAIRTK
jgi:predicted DNA-binding protein